MYGAETYYITSRQFPHSGIVLTAYRVCHMDVQRFDTLRGPPTSPNRIQLYLSAPKGGAPGRSVTYKLYVDRKLPYPRPDPLQSQSVGLVPR